MLCSTKTMDTSYELYNKVAIKLCNAAKYIPLTSWRTRYQAEAILKFFF